MCGIIGYIGSEDCKDITFDSLSKLEYRGYDSAGIGYQIDGQIQIQKKAGSIKELKDSISFFTSTCAIAHTRWATHGKVTKDNAHPHLSKSFALVHNGIIDNYKELKSKYHLNTISQTDSEVIVSLIEYNYQNHQKHIKNTEKVEKNGKSHKNTQKNNKNTSFTIIKAIKNSIDQLEGSYALAIINSDAPNTIFACKRQSPLYIAKTTKGILISSDISVYESIATSYYELNDNEYLIAQDNDITFLDKNLSIISKNDIKLKLEVISTNLGNHPHYMIKEIHDIPNALKYTISHYIDNFKLPTKLIKNIKSVHFIGCGTAYHSGLMGANIIEKTTKLPAYTHIASEFINNRPLLDKNGLYVFISQSGETLDTLTALRQIKKMGKKVIAITNVLHSRISKEADYVLPICAGKEIAVASTKAYNCQILAMQILAKYIKNIKNNQKNTIKTLKNRFFDKINAIITSNEPKELALKICNQKEIFFIGKGEDLVTANEASLKLKEISYINCSAFAAGELKHGTLALIDSNSICFIVLTNPKFLSKVEASISEIRARGGKCYLVTQLDINEDVSDYIIKLPNFNSGEIALTSIIFFQLLAYYTSALKGLNPDKPRNLAKSVTVG